MANIKAQDLPEKLTKAVPDDRVLMIDSEDYNRLKTQPAEYYRGDDGVSPTVEVIDTPPGQTPAGHTVEITDVNGKKSFFVKDGGGDMEKAVYDKNDNGIVDDAEALGGRPASDYVLKEEVQDNINTKTFELASFTDLTTGQAILDWYLAGKNPLISHTYSSASISGKYTLTLSGTTSNTLVFYIPNFYDLAGTGNLVGTNSLNKTKITITFNNNNEVTSITGGHDTEGHLIKADINYTTPYTPLYAGSPATKKYVDDSIASIPGTDAYTKAETDDLLADKQDTLVSGTNIKTINGNSLLGNGNIEIQGGTTISIDSELSATSENPVQNKVIKQALDTKANTTDIPDVSNFATKSELPDMTEYYDKTEVDALIPDVSGFITKDVNDLTNYTTTTAMNTALDGKADKSTTYTKTETDNLLNTKADKSTTYTKTEVDALIPDVSTLATKAEVNAKANSADVYTKTEIDEIISRMKEKCPCMRDGVGFFADEANSTISLNKVGTPTEATFEISTDKARTWTDYTIGDTITLANIGDSVYIRNKSETVVGLSTNNNNYYQFTMTGKIKASGDVNYMLCKNSTDTLVNYCYYAMFQNCTSLVQAPELPATTLATHCYSGMFESTSLVQAPELPATTLVTYCYDYMFYLCTSLVQAPTLPATTLTDYCYDSMFRGCTSLVQAPTLPATTLAERCYWCMFRGCTSLVQIPELPATTLTTYCYNSMFYGCTSIKLSTTQDADYTQPYRIPTTGTGTEGTSSLGFMFTSTGGTFKQTPTINTTYYLHKDNTIVG